MFLRILDSHADILFRSQATTLVNDSPEDLEAISLLDRLISLRERLYSQSQSVPQVLLQHNAIDRYTGLGDNSALGKAFTCSQASPAPLDPLVSPTTPLVATRSKKLESQLAYNGYLMAMAFDSGFSADVSASPAPVTLVRRIEFAQQCADIAHYMPMASFTDTPAPLDICTDRIAVAGHDEFAPRLPLDGYPPVTACHLSAQGYMTTASGAFFPHDTSDSQTSPDSYSSQNISSKHGSTLADMPTDPVALVLHNESPAQFVQDSYYPESHLAPVAMTAKGRYRSEDSSLTDNGSLASLGTTSGCYQHSTSNFYLQAAAPKDIFCAPDIQKLGHTFSLAPAPALFSCCGKRADKESPSPPSSSQQTNEDNQSKEGTSGKKRKARKRSEDRPESATPRKALGKQEKEVRLNWRRCKFSSDKSP